jgi:hypothetical protein
MTTGLIPPTDPPDFVPEDEPDTIATPEGDEEYGPDQPLPAGTEPVPERPRGDEPHTKEPLRGALE